MAQGVQQLPQWSFGSLWKIQLHDANIKRYLGKLRMNKD